jgi:hypothetical protein
MLHTATEHTTAAMPITTHRTHPTVEPAKLLTEIIKSQLCGTLHRHMFKFVAAEAEAEAE